jgi:TIR domain
MVTTPPEPNKTPDKAGASPTEEPKAAFISHNFVDADFATRLCNSLEANGFSCWLAERDIQPGMRWAEWMAKAVPASKSLILLATEAALGSVNVISEVHQAHKLAMPIYTVLIPPAQIRDEMDVYVSRFKWLPGSGKSPEDVAAVLGRVLANPLEWPRVATLAPSLRRTMLYRPAAFAKMVAAAAVALVLVLSAAAFTLHRVLARDYRQIGYVVMSPSADSGPPVRVHPNVWLTARGVPFENVRLLIATDTSDQSEVSLTQWPIPEQVGSSEQVVLAIPADSRRLTTCLIIPNPALGAPWRVTQQFTLRPGDEEIRVAETAEPRAMREDGSPCGVKP